MEDQTAFFLLGTVIGIVVTYLIIKLAVADATSKIRQQAYTQTNILIRMALKTGVTNEEIQECIDDAVPKK